MWEAYYKTTYQHPPPCWTHESHAKKKKEKKEKKDSASGEDVRYYFHTEIGGERERYTTIQWDREKKQESENTKAFPMTLQ